LAPPVTPGIDLAIVAAQRGYRLTVVVPDKSSREKVTILKAYGAEVVITTGAVPAPCPGKIPRMLPKWPGGSRRRRLGRPTSTTMLPTQRSKSRLSSRAVFRPTM
jgi:cystathionine beta-synthase